ncbi:MAG TPA: FkbM family methyltransferase [Blastocatellia bacterium]
MRVLKNGVKKLRGSQPFNFIATSLVHGLSSALNTRSEAVIKHLHRVGTVRSKLPNGATLVLWSSGDDWISNQVYWRGWDGYEEETTPLFFRMARSARVTIDVGAFVGYYSLLAAHANVSCQVYAFEPLEQIYQRLKTNVRLNSLSNVECISGAVGDTDGEAQFFHQGTNMPSSSSLSYEFMRSSVGASEVISSSVSLITIDRFVRERAIDRVDLVKIDTESTEPQVLRGMALTLRKDRPAIFCEVLQGRGTEHDLEEILGPLGYRYYLLTDRGPVERERIQGDPRWLNYLFIDRDIAELPS